ncbi:gephyrin-like molybdotransferase Glp [Tepidibacillus fermentans]|uniref:Molybdopterin molybdenumtransferase n=1 Tax=Tepidibacillus fermentans TaxID=1281767 RepID=A0A4R3KLQ4_9BACI|nr:gephyrin-like molybdotransferase Glp [Tepidibacillus fermentans]TCS84532.1 molybdopterin molybdochelatase [Tepidibacillus fermentans]
MELLNLHKDGPKIELFDVQQVNEVAEKIKQQFQAIQEAETVGIMEAVGRVLASDVVSKEDVPGFHRSTVDGYAVKASNTYGSSESMPSFFQIIGSVEMGKNVDQEIHEGEAMYVPTGGMMPKGADAVVMIEDVEVIGDLLNVFEQVAPRENVIFQGEDVKLNEVILKKGHRLRPQDLGGLAAIGITEVTVYRKIKVGILSTGDELVPPDTKKLLPGQIRDINGISISAAVQALGGEVIYGGIVTDEFAEYLRRSKELYDQVDFLILSGGSSMGTKDYSSRVMNELGQPGVFVHGVAIKPGKPTIIANCNGKPVMGLPGHPVSAMVLFDLFGTQILNQLHGVEPNRFAKQLKAKISRNVASQVGRTDFVRVQLEIRDEELWAIPVFGKSGLITNLVRSDGMIEIPEFKEGIVEGEWVNVTLFS